MIPEQLKKLCDIIEDTARQELLPRFADVQREFKQDGSIVTIADRNMQQELETRLQRAWPDYRLLGEEQDAQTQRQLMESDEQALWIVDPLDGTSNFTAGIPFFSVSVALMKNRRCVMGVVYDPTRDECFCAAEGEGAWLNDKVLRQSPAPDGLKRTIAAIDFKRLEPGLATALVAAPPYSSQRSFGSVALDWCWVAAGRFHVYLHGKQKLWDYAAGQLILSEAGGHSQSLDGEPVFAPSIAPRSALAAHDDGIFNEWRDWLSGQG